MAKWLCFAIVVLLLNMGVLDMGILNIGTLDLVASEKISGKGMDEKIMDEMTKNSMQHFGSNFFSSFIHRIIIKMKNYAPVALMKSCEGIVGKSIVFDASSSYDVNGDALQYRWDFDNDGVYDTPWMALPRIAHTYSMPYNGFVRLQVSDGKFTDECIARVMVTDAAKGDVDQSQEKADDFVKIYGDKKYAQSFKPSMIGFEGFDILIERKGVASYDNIFSVIGRMLSKIFRFGETNQFFVGDLVVGLYRSLSYSGKIMEKVFSPQDISRARSWIHIDFETELDPRETYYIVVYQTGGSEWQYYKWYYGSGDPYDRGSSYNYEGGWNEDTSK
ncbi:MAG: PKD domain-containing protein, partial [Thermoplasmata archaeon]|nr:PKD domain-containing protein [Thermoplasmata archaeon]